MEEFYEENMPVNPLKLGEAYLEYCVRQGWLTKIGEGQAAQYELTEAGAKSSQLSLSISISRSYPVAAIPNVKNGKTTELAVIRRMSAHLKIPPPVSRAELRLTRRLPAPH